MQADDQPPGTGPGSNRPPDSINDTNVARWLTENVDGAVAPFSYSPISGGNSNLTFRVADAAGKVFVLRRPPLNSVLATAHDMAREWRAIRGLQSTPVPVPPALGFCSDPEVTGAPFYVMGFVDGVVQHSLDQTLVAFSPQQRRRSGESLLDVLADLHALDIDEIGLGDHGPRRHYLERQLARWYRQYTETRTTEIPDIDRTHVRLLDTLPETGDVTVVHGDFRLGNCIAAPDGHIAAVLDWEISTLGDPLADLAYCLNGWARPGTTIGRLADAADLPTMADGFGSSDEMLERYALRSGRDVSGIGFYVAFNHWKYACIVQGVLSRYLSGALGSTDGVDLEGFARSIEQRAALASESLDALDDA